MEALTTTELAGLKLVTRGKVRDIYELPEQPDCLLFVATDRVSAFDVIMKNGIPSKGQLLTQLSQFWFDFLEDVVPNHVVTGDVSKMPASVRKHEDILRGRTLLVKKAKVLKCEAIVRGYLTGSAFSEYEKHGTVHGIKLPPGLQESSKLPKPLFTPSTKADVGEKDENIHPDRLPSLLPDPSWAPVLTQTAIDLYGKAAEHALKVGLILADTKFEFGLLSNSETAGKPILLLIDEALTPDSSRFWPAAEWSEGKRMTGIDKQYLREWLKSGGGGFGDSQSSQQEGVQIPGDIVDATWERYLEAFRKITGRDFTAK
ncbi:hypothetical protein E5Q_06681 [Mixia osmundae IAM 14324]|uniref:Phosphoribosylaminoimidazole-succinocarboxamide synthase n=1 Tax=Mixia osmundae (strain CBS 9802 / IAM 14324 / JCM 22182 / KY 12970) TaxID=764103 RepID=G7EAW8_MIXOS|nr:hypothetical protein E5Q_06681 [Mixia osmundae IAM 14324]